MSSSTRKARRLPSYRLHKSSGQAIVTLPDGRGGRRDFLLGPYGSAASTQEYDRLVAEWASHGQRLWVKKDEGVSVAEVLVAYLKHCAEYYRGPDGVTTGELANIKKAMRHVRELYGTSDAVEFDSRAIKAVRQKMIDSQLCRRRINLDISRIRRCFRWAASEKMIPASVFHELQTVEGLRFGRCGAKETDPVQPVPVQYVDAVLPFLPRVVADMVRLQLLTGMRAGELVIMRGKDLDTTGAVWLYRPAQHKNTYRGHQRVIALGPKAQAIVRNYLKAHVDAFLFSPRESMRLTYEKQKAERRTTVYPYESRRKKPKGRRNRMAGERYTPSTYAQAIQNGWAKAEADAHKKEPHVPHDQILIPRWTSHQLRHTAAQLLSREYGLEAARAVLGHRNANLTALYASIDTERAAEIMKQVG